MSPRPTLLFSPYAWAKLVYLRDLGPTEIGGFGISHPLNPLLVIDVCLIQQLATPVTVTFDDTAVADFFDAQVDRGFAPQQFARIWIHTHPGISPQPSRTDEETFARVFAECDWSVMFILTRSGDHYARLRFNTGPGATFDFQSESTIGHGSRRLTPLLGRPSIRPTSFIPARRCLPIGRTAGPLMGQTSNPLGEICPGPLAAKKSFRFKTATTNHNP